MDYRETLQLPKTPFPMRGNLAKREPDMLQEWQAAGLYDKLQALARQEGRKPFILHDGPPYANERIHIGTALNKVLKDMVVRSRTMDGYHCPYIPGWDTHGLPIEHQVIKETGVNRHEADVLTFRGKCRAHALRYVDVQREEFARLGVWGDWDNPYLTLDPAYEAKQIEVFGDMAREGHIYKGLKPVYWCPSCETALAEAEIEYADHRSPSIYVAFPVRDGKGLLPDDAHVLIWTTTPWTLPANLAIALHPGLDYALVATDYGLLLLAKDLVNQVAELTGVTVQGIRGEWTGRDLEGVLCGHPLLDRDSVVILGEHVTLEQGTGCVHTAPGHGHEDYEVGMQYQLPVFCPVDGRGRFTDEAGPYAGQFVEKANSRINGDLQAAGRLLHQADLTHPYPHCWRCKGPVLFRATEQWFASVEGFRDAALQAIQEVTWIPGWGRERIHGMVADRSDWCISRQRTWGVPIPIFYCDGCGEHLVDDDSIQAVADIFRQEGSDAWFARSAAEILPAGKTCRHCGGASFSKETDIMDVWFDSGSSHAAVLTQREELTRPADMYLEGSDQHRGWFQSSLLTAVATTGRPPYRSVLTHGFVVDAEGRKMSKSLGNVVAPAKVMQKYGADILRLWVASSDYRGDIRVSDDILGQLVEVYRRIRNTCRFLLGNIGDFDPKGDAVPEAAMRDLDRWAVTRVRRLARKAVGAYREYEFHGLYHAVHHFCAVDMGGFYLDAVKDRLYCEGADSRERRSAQTALWEVLHTLVRLIAPVLTFTSEEVWRHLPESARDQESVHLTTWLDVEQAAIDSQLETRWDALLQVRRVVAKALEEARNAKLIGGSTEAAVGLYLSSERARELEAFRDEAALAEIFIVSAVKLHPADTAVPEGALSADGVGVVVVPASGEKCQRCWRYAESVGASADYPDLCSRCAGVVAKDFAEA